MSIKTGPRAARKRINGSKWASGRSTRTRIILLPGLLELAEANNICAPSGRGGMQTLSEFFQDALIAAIREKQRLIKERIEKNEG